MPASRTDGASILKHYRLQDPFPTAWSDPVDDAQQQQANTRRKSTVRYSVLQEENVSSTLKGLIGAELYDGATLPRDEPDPLGSTDSVVRVLKQRGLPVEDNVRLRSRYLVSSKHFSPAVFLRDVHANTPTPTLQQGLNYLSQSIAQKSGSLKDLVENNFDRFVTAKATIEGVYREMKENVLGNDKEAEYGVGKIRGYLNEVDMKAHEVFGPIMSGRGREEGLRLLLGTLEKHEAMLNIPSNILECIKRKEYDALQEEYQKARQHWDDSRALVPDPKAGLAGGVKEEHIHQLIIAEKMWNEVTFVVEEFKKDTWKRLVECKTEDNTHMELIQILLELGVDENPIAAWLISRHDYLKGRITAVFERSRVEIEVRRQVLRASPPSPQAIGHHLRSPARWIPSDSKKSFDIPAINAFWEVVHNTMVAMLDSSTGVLGELLNFWKVAQSFIDGDNLLPVGIDDQSRKHHRLSDQDVLFLRTSAVELVAQVRSCMVTFFQEPPIDDVSALYSPLPPLTPASATPKELDFPPPSAPKMRGQEDDDVYAFFPPGANSLGAVHYMGKVMLLLGKAAASLAEVFAGLRGSVLEELRSMLSTARERTVKAVAAAWLTDSANCKLMEDWTRPTDNRGVTKMPGYFLAFEKEIIGGMQSIIYLDNVRNGETSVIPPPSAKLLINVRGQFVRTLYKALQGMVENAQSPAKTEDSSDTSGLGGHSSAITAANLTAHSIDSRDKKTRMLLTLSNLQLLRSEIAPELISQFENAFSVKLTEESKTIRDTLGQIDKQLFDEYTTPLVNTIADIVRNGLFSPTWAPPPGKMAVDVRPYIYDALLCMVDVHAQVTITAPSLVQQVISFLLEQFSKEILEAFRKKRTFTLGELLQATLDVEFVNQTLSQFNTPKSSEYQQLVYVELDRGSDGDARAGLQNELGEMKRLLSSLRRSSRAEFLCFRAKKPSSKRTNAHITEGEAR